VRHCLHIFALKVGFTGILGGFERSVYSVTKLCNIILRLSLDNGGFLHS
jgi:hypothetical protein